MAIVARRRPYFGDVTDAPSPTLDQWLIGLTELTSAGGLFDLAQVGQLQANQLDPAANNPSAPGMNMTWLFVGLAVVFGVLLLVKK